MRTPVSGVTEDDPMSLTTQLMKAAKVSPIRGEDWAFGRFPSCTCRYLLKTYLKAPSIGFRCHRGFNFR